MLVHIKCKIILVVQNSFFSNIAITILDNSLMLVEKYSLFDSYLVCSFLVFFYYIVIALPIIGIAIVVVISGS